MVRDVLWTDEEAGVDVVCSIATIRWGVRSTAQSQQAARRRIGNKKEGATVHRTDGNSPHDLAGRLSTCWGATTHLLRASNDDVGSQDRETSQ